MPVSIGMVARRCSQVLMLSPGQSAEYRCPPAYEARVSTNGRSFGRSRSQSFVGDCVISSP